MQKIEIYFLQDTINEIKTDNLKRVEMFTDVKCELIAELKIQI